MKKEITNNIFTAIGTASAVICLLDAIPRYKSLFIFLFGISIGYFLCHFINYRKRKSLEDAFLDGLKHPYES